MGNHIEIIAGPDGVRDVRQMKAVAAWADDNGINTIRGGIYKPRSSPMKNKVPVWLGLGAEAGIPIVQESLVGTGKRFVMEFIEPEQVDATADRLADTPEIEVDGQIGARTGPGNTIAKITERIAARLPKAKIVVKNQMEVGVEPWVSRVEWAGTGAPEAELIGCARGHSPGNELFRNSSNLMEALELKKMLGIPMLIDISHTAGISPENVMLFAQLAIGFHNQILDKTGIQVFDGVMMEIDPFPEEAQCDRDQLLPLCLASALVGTIQEKMQVVN